jgi:murein DD-endopeptidase MepM/ murein hydrolase activator NlpD
MIDHGGGYATAYGHNSREIVSCGQEVAQGQVISYSGCTGFCTGPHVHFEIRIDGTPVDPLGFLG